MRKLKEATQIISTKNLTSPTFLHFLGTADSQRNENYTAAGVIFLYCLAYAVFRLFVSTSMELSEAEQFLDASAFSLGQDQQTPLYSWLIRAVSLVLGMNIITLTVVKYSLLFLFYYFVFLTARNFWDRKRSLIITGSLLLFPTYSYETHRDLTHTILVSLMAVMTCHVYIRMMREPKTRHYVLSGVFIGLGLLSKYNFVFFLTAFLMSLLSGSEGRRVLFDKRTLLSVLCVILVLLPHFLWLAQEDFLSVRYAMSRARAGEMVSTPPLRLVSVIGFSFMEVFVYILVTWAIFRRYFSIKDNEAGSGLRLFRLLALYGLVIPLLVIFSLNAGNFSSRWLAPVLFTLPLTVFSFIRTDNIKSGFRSLAYLCAGIAIIVLAGRIFVGFSPDTAGKVERLHIPYRALSLQLTGKLKENGIEDFRGLSVIADADGYERSIAANIMMWIPGTKFVPMRDMLADAGLRERITERGGIFAFDVSRHGNEAARRIIDTFPSARPLITLNSAYLHSSIFPPYVLGVVIIPGKGAWK
ncbi:MAG: glycosyltransferase family 39 protein [Nitrospirae bacterium]|nr:glycosyltransferase family 39 protein [Nitrospirota bacterium]